MEIKMYRTLVTLAAAAVLLAGCNVREYPTSGRPGEEGFEELNSIGISVRFKFALDMPDYTTVEVLEDTRGYFSGFPNAAGYDARYTVKVFRYQNGYDNTLDLSAPVFSESITVADLDHLADTTLDVRLDGEKYQVLVWMDFVEKGTEEDAFYSTGDFTAISWQEGHSGSNDFLQAFRGITSVDLSRYQGAGITIDRPVKMVRPMAKYRIVATDREGFLTQYRLRHGLDAKGDDDPDDLDLSSFHAVLTYTGNVPCEYNLFSDVPTDVTNGLSFTSPLRMLEDGTIELGTDYIFVEERETPTTVTVQASVYEDGFKSPLSNITFNLPLQRGCLTTARGGFLTGTGGGGITVSPTFDGEFDYTF